MFKRFALMAVLVITSVAAIAMPRPSEVKAAFASGNYALAESLLQDVMKERPTATVHYQLGQVYAKEGKHNEALNEFRQAQALDPSLKFASSASIFLKNLTDEQAIVAPPPVTTVVQVQPTLPPAHPEHPTSLFGVLIFILVVGGAILLFFVFKAKREEQNSKNAQTTDDREKTNKLLEYTKRLEDALLITKTANYDDAMKTKITERISALLTNVRGAIADIKDGNPLSSVRLVSFQNLVEIAEHLANDGWPADEKVEPIAPTPYRPQQPAGYTNHAYPPRAEADLYVPPVAPAPQPTVVHHYHNTPAPAPVVVNNGNDGLLTGVLIGEMLSNHHEDRTVYVEREREPAPRYEAPAPRYEAPAKLDTNDDDDYKRSDSGTLDTGSSSSDSYSSPDSSSFDSGSSSSDSY